MALDDERLWTVMLPSERVSLIRADLDARMGTPILYDRTLDGGYTWAAARSIWRVEQGGALIVSALDPGTAPPAALLARAADAGLTPYPATSAEVLATVTGSGTAIDGATVRDNNGNEWTVIAVYADAGYTPVSWVSGEAAVSTGYVVHLQAVEAGELSVGTAFVAAPAWSGVTMTLGDLLVAPRDAETTAELRARLIASDYPSGSMAGLQAALLDVPGVSAVAIERTAPGVLAVSMATDGALVSAVDFATALYRHMPATAELTGTESVTITGVDGRDVVISYSVLTSQEVDVTAVIITDDTVSDADVLAGVRIAIEGVFARLAVGETVRLLRLQAAIATVEGVVGIGELELDGDADDVSPATVTVRLSAKITSLTVAP